MGLTTRLWKHSNKATHERKKKTYLFDAEPHATIYKTMHMCKTYIKKLKELKR